MGGSAMRKEGALKGRNEEEIRRFFASQSGGCGCVGRRRGGRWGMEMLGQDCRIGGGRGRGGEEKRKTEEEQSQGIDH